jgi:hypothetical protein
LRSKQLHLEDEFMDSGSSALSSGPPAAPEEHTGSRLGIWLALTAAVLAFLLASTPTRRTEVWSHLARGRALVVGEVQPDRNPQLLVPEDEPGRYRTVLYDLVLFGAFRALGGTGVAVLNAALAALLALVVFRAGRTSGNLVVVGLCTVLTVLATAPWLELSPVLLSYLFLALTIVLLRTAVHRTETGTGLARTRWLLLALIAVWANVDRWVVLGPLAIGLLALAEWARERGAVARALGGLFLAALAASLLSPNHIGAWALARTLGSAAPEPAHSPLALAWYRTGPIAVGVVYALLVLFGVLAFWRDPEKRTRAWAPLWLALMGLAAWSPAGAPFFAVAAGPIAALSLSRLHWAAARTVDHKPRWIVRQLRLGGRLLAPVVALVPLAVAWPGWITGPPYGRPTWVVPVDDSLRDAVLEVAQQRRAGAFGPGARGLTLSPEVADYWSWFGAAAGEQGGGGDGNRDVAEVQTGILGQTESGKSSGGDWRTVLRAHGVNHLILHVGSNPRTEQVVRRLAGLPDECPLLYLRGRTVVFGWRDPQSPGAGNRLAELRVSVDRRAFRPGPDDRAPLDGPDRGPGARPWARAFVEPILLPSQDRDEAGLYLAYFDGHRAIHEVRNRVTWLSAQQVSLTANVAQGVPTPASVAGNIGLWAHGVRGDWETYRASQDEGPLGALLLAVRSARRAIRADPDDAKSYFLLGEAYWRLSQATRERVWRYQLPAFERIRQVQAITAFRQALVLRPDSPAAHGRLARIYRDHGSWDLALEHIEKLITISKAQAQSGSGEKSDADREAVAALEKERDGLAARVREREEQIGVGKENRRVLDLARDAYLMGLPRRALEILLKSDASEFGSEGVRLELDLLLWTGRVEDVRAWLDPGLEKRLGASTYHEILACLAAATGNYREAGEEMSAVATALMQVPSRLPTPYTQASYDIVRALLAAPFVDANPAGTTHQSLVRQGLLVEVQQIAGSLGREGNALVVGGLLALEAGEVERAEDLFNRALSRWNSGEPGGTAFGVDFAGRTVAQDGLRLITAHQSAR